jgi:hypothetical protein
MVYSFEDIAGKADWEGGLDEALSWFSVREVPEEIRDLWQKAKDLKIALNAKLDEISEFLPED